MSRPMIVLALAFAASASFGAAASSAQAADDPGAADIRCLAVAAAMSGSADATVKTAGLYASLYYLGKLDGRTPNLDLEGRLKEVMTSMKPQDIQAEASRCGAELQKRGQTVQDIGARLQSAAPKTE